MTRNLSFPRKINIDVSEEMLQKLDETINKKYSPLVPRNPAIRDILQKWIDENNKIPSKANKNIDGSVIGWNRQKDDGGENIMKFNKKKSQHTQAAHITQKTGLKHTDAALICEIAEGIQKNNQDEDGGEEL